MGLFRDVALRLVVDELVGFILDQVAARAVVTGGTAECGERVLLQVDALGTS